MQVHLLSLLLEEFPLGAEPVLFVLPGFAAATFIQFVGSLPYFVPWVTVFGTIASFAGEFFGATATFGFDCMGALGSNIGHLQIALC